MEIFYLLWLLQIVFEPLPISSSGHIELIINYLKKNYILPDNYTINKETGYIWHVPTALVLFVFLMQQYWKYILAIPDNLAYFWHLSCLIIIANSITGIFYFLFTKISVHKFRIAWGFCITTFILSSLFWVSNTHVHSIKFIHAGLIGAAQGLSLLPGISRLASTYAMGVWLGLSAYTALLFSLTIEFPLILAATAKALYAKKSTINSLVYKMSGQIILRLIGASIIAYMLIWLIMWQAQAQLLAFWALYMFIALSACLIFKNTKN